MTEEQEFIQELTSNYKESGWTALSPIDCRDELGFEPDLLLRRGDEVVVIEVKREGFVGTKATKLIRNLVESKPGWKFELKFLPSSRKRSDHPVKVVDINRRIKLSSELQRNGNYNEAFILLRTAMKAALRNVVVSKEDTNMLASDSLFERAYEDGYISDGELRQLLHGLQARNLLVHGLDVGDAERDSSEIMQATKRLFAKLGYDQIPTPA